MRSAGLLKGVLNFKTPLKSVTSLLSLHRGHRLILNRPNYSWYYLMSASNEMSIKKMLLVWVENFENVTVKYISMMLMK